jgi:O-acetyl-ADP-ribose deacetylase (regulator of RNase III)
MSTFDIVLLVVAVACGIVALALHFWQTRGDGKQVEQSNLLKWFFFALFASMVLFLFFPASGASGSLIGFALTGAVAAFFLIWVLGSRRANTAEEIDGLNNQVKELEANVVELQKQLEISETGGPVAQVIPTSKVIEYKLKDKRSKRVGLVTGDLRKTENIADVWVNTENTNMQMARFHERSISGLIRYLGAKKNEALDIEQDIIADELREQTEGFRKVQPAATFITSSGELKTTHGVKKIIHVASVNGEPGQGYRPVNDIGNCIKQVLIRANSEELKADEIETVLIPLLGAGNAKGDLEDTAKLLIEEAISFMESTPNNNLDAVYFIVRTDLQLNACKAILDGSDKVVKA